MAILAIPDDYPTLSAALVDADDGDEIAIDGGEWITGDLTGAVSVAVTVRGVSVGGTTLTVTDPQGIEVTGDVTFTDLTVSGGGAGRPFQVEGTGQLTLDGVAMVDGTSTDLGGLVLVRDQSDLVAVDASFTGGQALFGGAVAIGGRGGATFTRVTFEHNRVSGGGSDGGAVRLAEDATATFDTCTFTENTSLNHVGGAIALLNGAASATVIGSTFTENVAGTWGGAIALYDGNTLTVSDSTFTANRATDGGAIGCFAGEACTVTVTGSSFVGDVANRGGALFADVGAVSLTDVAFTGSTAADEGGAVFLFAGSIDATDVRFVDAHADGSGGAVYVEDAGVDFVRTVFCRSSADAAGGAIYARRPTAFRVTNASFFGNTAADEGAAIRFRDRTGAVLQSTFIDDESASLAGVIGADGGPGLAISGSVFSGGSRPALVAVNTTLHLSWSAFWDTTPYAAGVDEQDPVALASDPFPDLDPATDCPDAAIPVYDGVLVDVGDPADHDLDDSQSDLGATGGPDGDPALWVDGDGDGVAAMWDCDDADPAVALGECVPEPTGGTTTPTTGTTGTGTPTTSTPRAPASLDDHQPVGCGCRIAAGSGGPATWLALPVGWWLGRGRRRGTRRR